jgi:hypothetical protein
VKLVLSRKLRPHGDKAAVHWRAFARDVCRLSRVPARRFLAPWRLFDAARVQRELESLADSDAPGDPPFGLRVQPASCRARIHRPQCFESTAFRPWVIGRMLTSSMAGLHPSHPWIILDHVPIYVLEYPVGGAGTYFDELAAMYAEFLGWLKRKPTKHVLISDLRKLNSTARGRQMATEFYLATKAYEGSYLLGRGYLTLDERNRHVITAVTWGSSSEIPKAFFDNTPAALAWARSLLVAA